MAYLGRPASAEVSVTGSTDTFTGDGGVTFNLSRVVTDSNPSLLEVFVSNVQQQPTVTFSVASNVLTFTTAPGVGEPIYVTYRDYPVAPVFTIPDASITAAKIQNGAVTNDKIGSIAVTEGKIANQSVTEAKIGSAAVTTSKIADANVTTSKIQDAAVTTSKIADANVTIAKLNINADLNFAAANIFNAGLKVENVISTSNVTTLNYANATVFLCTATEQSNITLSNFPQEGIALLKLRNGGAFTFAYAGNAYFATGTAPTLTASGLDFLYFQGNTLGYLVTSVLDIQED
jgi:hypothetical protein